MSTNNGFWKYGNDKRGNPPPPCYDSPSRPPYEFYEHGITEANKGWLEAIITSARNAGGRYLVASVAVIFLCKIACEFIANGNEHLGTKAFIGALLIAAMILTIGLVSLLWVKDTNATEIQKTEKNKDKPPESGTCGKGSGQNRRPSIQDRGPNSNGGGK
jgi:hypothetical protein